MFDIGFWEIVLISVIGLIVLGPERLPVAIRSVRRWLNTTKKMANSVKTEISRELDLHELNQQHADKADQQARPDIEFQTQEAIEQNNVIDKTTAQQQDKNDDCR